MSAPPVTSSKLRRIFVRTDRDEFNSTQIKRERDTLDLANINAAKLLADYREWQAKYAVVPFDPSGHRTRIYPGGYTVVSGNPGAGKTTLLRQVVASLLRPVSESDWTVGPRVFVASLEEPPAHVLIRHSEVACGLPADSLTGNHVQWCADQWCDRLRLWNYDPEEEIRYRRIFAAIRVLAATENVRYAVIDNLMSLDVPENDNEAQRTFAAELLRTCLASGVHVFLVAHPRKPQGTVADPQLADVAGSANITRKAANVWFVKRSANEAESAALLGEHITPMRIELLKTREDPAFIGTISGFYNRRFRQFVTDPAQAAPISYLSRRASMDIGLNSLDLVEGIPA